MPPLVCIVQGKLGTRSECKVGGVVKIDSWVQTVLTFEHLVGGVVKTGCKQCELSSRCDQQMISFGMRRQLCLRFQLQDQASRLPCFVFCICLLTYKIKIQM